MPDTLQMSRLANMRAAAARVARDDAGLAGLASAGDDYELLSTLPPGARVAGATMIGTVAAGSGLTVLGVEGRAFVPARLGYEH